MMTRLENLPNELLLQMMDYLSIPKIFTSFLDLNQRLQYLILPFLHRIDLTDVSLAEFRLFSHYVFRRFGHRVISFKLSNDYHLRQTDLFVNDCPNFARYLCSLEKLTLVKCSNVLQNGFLRNALAIRTLRQLELIDVTDRKGCLHAILSDLYRPHQLEKLTIIRRTTTDINDSYSDYSYTIIPQRYNSLKYLDVDVQVLSDVLRLCNLLPSLRYFKVNVAAIPSWYGEGVDYGFPQVNDKDFQLAEPSPFLAYFHLGISFISFNQLQLLISQFRHSLTHLSITVDTCPNGHKIPDLMNGNLWEEFFTQILTNVIDFDLLLKSPLLSSFPFEQCLRTFCTPFWFNRKWFIDLTEQGSVVQLNTRQFISRHDQTELQPIQYIETLRSNQITLDQHQINNPSQLILLDDSQHSIHLQPMIQFFRTFSQMTTFELNIIDSANQWTSFDWNGISLPNLTRFQFTNGSRVLFYQIFTISPRLKELRINAHHLHDILSQINHFPLTALHLLHLTLNFIPSSMIFQSISTFLPNIKHLIITWTGLECQGQLDLLLTALLNQYHFNCLSTIQFEWMRLLSSLNFRANPLDWFEQHGLQCASFQLYYRNNIEENNQSRKFDAFLCIPTPDDSEELQLWLSMPTQNQ